MPISHPALSYATDLDTAASTDLRSDNHHHAILRSKHQLRHISFNTGAGGPVLFDSPQSSSSSSANHSPMDSNEDYNSVEYDPWTGSYRLRSHVQVLNPDNLDSTPSTQISPATASDFPSAQPNRLTIQVSNERHVVIDPQLIQQPMFPVPQRPVSQLRTTQESELYNASDDPNLDSLHPEATFENDMPYQPAQQQTGHQYSALPPIQTRTDVPLERRHRQEQGYFESSRSQGSYAGQYSSSNHGPGYPSATATTPYSAEASTFAQPLPGASSYYSPNHGTQSAPYSSHGSSPTLHINGSPSHAYNGQRPSSSPHSGTTYSPNRLDQTLRPQTSYSGETWLQSRPSSSHEVDDARSGGQGSNSPEHLTLPNTFPGRLFTTRTLPPPIRSEHLPRDDSRPGTGGRNPSSSPEYERHHSASSPGSEPFSGSLNYSLDLPDVNEPYGSEAGELKARRHRTTPRQFQALTEVYNRTAFPSTQERLQLAEKLTMQPRQVQIWFQNRRQQEKNRVARGQPVPLQHRNVGRPRVERIPQAGPETTREWILSEGESQFGSPHEGGSHHVDYPSMESDMYDDYDGRDGPRRDEMNYR